MKVPKTYLKLKDSKKIPYLKYIFLCCLFSLFWGCPSKNNSIRSSVPGTNDSVNNGQNPLTPPLAPYDPNSCVQSTQKMIYRPTDQCILAPDSCAAAQYKQIGWDYAVGTECTEGNQGSGQEPGSQVSYGDSTGSSSAGCSYPGISDSNDNSQQEYYRIPISGQGQKKGAVVFNSLQKGINLQTDKRLHVRLKARPQPNNYGICFTFPYTELTVDVRLKGTTQVIRLERVKVNECSPVRAFDLSSLYNNNAPAIEVLNVQGNYRCSYYSKLNISQTGPWCPYAILDPKECYSLEIHVSTDFTKLMP